ncbi:hypothetical protein CDL12_24778 [Handroanthus impetiginosus]|uniref:Uncharacterized protein n=1 Tax=Handroanthus impetiginosus TaxID=429701 RepID=A0A2G9GBN6_9LAMI|nr:hypothetical protein CDL12_24778 [Handroanthus impetiginosus]
MKYELAGERVLGINFTRVGILGANIDDSLLIQENLNDDVAYLEWGYIDHVHGRVSHNSDTLIMFLPTFWILNLDMYLTIQDQLTALEINKTHQSTVLKACI